MKNISFSRKHKFKSAIFTFAIISGFVSGCLVNFNNRIFSYIPDFSDELMARKTACNLLSLFFDSFLSNLIYFLLIYFFSFFKIGFLFIFLLLIIYGFENGILISCVFSSHCIDDLLFIVISVLPGVIFFACSLIYSASGRICSKGVNTCRLSEVKKSLIYIFLIIFTAGLDVTFTALYKLLLLS